ncbi:MAG TPA: thioredoxin domain-containing protein, partial [Deltaproteobacteria bacterium]|nr:thioredoxin domain-containing protein [Deltaproteobacteria bacterium]
MAQQLDEAARLAGASDQPYVNRLILESSPYLRQHAHNPVDWYPWGDEALARAQALDRPILLSVGYSTCHWCHVMAHESFEDPQIAALINQGFVPVKVDREERPDIDEVYMAAVLAMNRGRGGWPMTLVLTPTGEPLFAATYLPARDGDRGSRRGLQYVLTQLSDDWRERRSELLAHAAQITEHLVRLAAPAPPGDVPGPEAIPGAIERLMEGYDPVYGGFGPAPRFPRPVLLELLLRSAQQPPRDAAITT